MENITMTEEPPVPPPSPETTQREVRLIDVEITNENMAFNVLVSFLGVAQQRGTFSIAESAKIYECIQKFVSTKQE